MKALVVYDSFFGNTEKIAQVVGSALSGYGEVDVVRVGQATPERLRGLDLLVIGSPTRAFSASPETKKLLAGLAPHSLDGVKVAAFDTRISLEDTKSAILKFLVNIFGYAAKPIANKLKKAGGRLAAPPEGFVVLGSEGPLKDGELERAETWAKGLV